jgi:DNA-binding transcriptional LysR family regulator
VDNAECGKSAGRLHSAALSPTHPLAREPRISLKQLAHESFVLFPSRRESGFYERIIAICQKSGFVPKVLEGIVDFRTMLLMVAEGYGVSLMPPFPTNTDDKHVAYAQLNEAYATIELCAAWKAADSSRHVAGFLDTVRACCHA